MKLLNTIANLLIAILATPIILGAVGLLAHLICLFISAGWHIATRCGL